MLLTDSSWCPTLPVFLSCVFLGLPLVLVLVPFCLLSMLLKMITCNWCAGKKQPAGSAPELPVTESPVAFEAREYDLVLFGATGFTGTLAAEYLAKNYGNTIRWAIAGRNMDKLSKLREQLVALDPAMSELPLLEAAASDVNNLRKVVRQTRVVLSTVGPFARHGTPLVAVCASEGVSYCDITGEIAWCRKMIDRYDDVACKSGAKIVHCCGHDCVPWDLLTQYLAEGIVTAGKPNETITKVRTCTPMG